MNDINRLFELKKQLKEVENELEIIDIFEDMEYEEIEKTFHLYNKWENLTAKIFYLTAPQNEVDCLMESLKLFVDPEIVDSYIKSQGR